MLAPSPSLAVLVDLALALRGLLLLVEEVEAGEREGREREKRGYHWLEGATQRQTDTHRHTLTSSLPPPSSTAAAVAVQLVSAYGGCVYGSASERLCVIRHIIIIITGEVDVRQEEGGRVLHTSHSYK